MALRLEEVVPWGRCAREYVAMFALTPQDLDMRLLDCGAGPSSFTAELSAQGRRVTACDPLFAFSAEQIRRQIAATSGRMTALAEANRDRFRWDVYRSPLRVERLRLATMRRFLDDYPAGCAQGRYVVGTLPPLPFRAESFDLALCSHLLFTYSEPFSTAFHCFVLEHLAQPGAALVSLHRLLRPGGSLTVIEGDHGSAYFHPQSAAAQTAIRCQVELQRRAGGNALIGRQLYPLLVGAGFEAVAVSPRLVYADASRPDLVEGFTRKTFTAMITGVRQRAITAGLIAPETFDAGMRALYRTTEADGVFCYTFFKGVGVTRHRAEECGR